MKLESTIRERLLNNNPFSFNAVGDPRENDFPDVEGIDQTVTRSIIQLIAQKQKQPRIPLAATVLGEAGSGKTHMIGRLIRAGSKGDVPFSFAYIRPFIDPHRAFRYLLQEIVSNLTRTSSSREKHRQIEYVCGQIFAQVLFKVAKRNSDNKIFNLAKKCQKEPLKALELSMSSKTRESAVRSTKKFLKDNHDDLNLFFLDVLLQYFFYEEKRDAARRWLMGRTIDEEDCELLGIRDDRSKQTPESLEDEACQILSSLDLILHVYGDRPLIVFFDQLENLTSKEQLKKFNHLIWFLSATTQAMMPIAFFRGLDWEKRFETSIDDFTIRRLKNNMFPLQGCTQDQAQAIIKSRLDTVLADLELPDPLYPFYPLCAEEFDKKINKNIKWPSRVINRANQMLYSLLIEKAPPIISPDKILVSAFTNKISNILAEFNQFEPDEGRLTLALHLYLNNRPENAGYTVKQLNESLEKIKYIDLVGSLHSVDGSTYQVAFLVDVELHFRTVGASLRKGITLMQKSKTNRALFIRDMRGPFPELPKWPATNQRLQELEDAGGSKIFLDKEAAAHWYALALLKFDIEAGDVSCEDGTSITRSQFNAFIQDWLNGKDYPAFAQLDNYLKAIPTPGKERNLGNSQPTSTTSPEQAPPKKTPSVTPVNPPVTKPSPEEIAKMADKILKQVPVRMLKADLLVDKLSEKHPISTDNLLLLLEDYHEQFTLIRAIDHTIIKLN